MKCQNLFSVETICIKCQNLFSGKNKKNINLLSAEVALRVVIIAPACSRVRYRRPIVCPSVRPSVSIYTKQPSNLA